jgi:hypothetical protein
MKQVFGSRSVEFLVFVRDMADFERNRGTLVAQETLLRTKLGSRHRFLGAFDDSGNYAFATSHDPEGLCHDVLTALRTTYRVHEAVVVPREDVVAALDTLERAALKRYGNAFSSRTYGVQGPSGTWRVGVVFVSPPIPAAQTKVLFHIDTSTLATLTVAPHVVSVAKLDAGRRIPWGYPAREVARRLKTSLRRVVTTGRSGRTVRGAVGLFPRNPPGPRGERA